MENIGRDALNKIKNYQPGKSIESVQKEFNLERIFKLASNENPLGASKKVIAGLKEDMNSLHRYPDPYCLTLKEALGAKLKVEVEQLIIGNGSDEIIKIIGESFLDEGDKVLVGVPSFSEYDYISNLMGAELIKVPLKDFTYDLGGILKMIDPQTKIIFICNPNNPTGTKVLKEDLDNFMRKVPKEVLVVFDEAYSEYASENYYSGLNYLEQGFPNVLVLKTFSKAYGLAALRIGYGIGNRELISWITKAKEPFNVNELAQRAAFLALEDEEHLSESLRVNEEGKEFLMKEFLERGFTPYETDANFLWVDLKRDGDKLFKDLLAQGVIIRQGSVFGYPEFMRVTIGTEIENKALIAALDKVLEV